MANDFNSIQISGALLSNEFVLSCTRPGGTFDAFAASTFDPSWKRDEAFKRGLTHAWESARERFDAIERDLPGMEVSDVRERWILPLSRHLGFRPVYQKSNTQIPGTNLSFRISHRGWDGPEAPALQVFAPEVELDTKPAERGARSPHADLQEYLNQDTSQTWALLTNGLQLRLLRDYFHTSQAGYVQFDLVQMFLTRDLDEFRALFRLAHASRWLPMGSDATVAELEAGEADLEPDDESDDADTVDEDVDEDVGEPQRAIRLEHYYQHSRAQGSRAEGDLRGSVKNALEVLGDGLLDDDLRARLEDQDELNEYYRQLLRVVYRCIFLLFAEQRGLVPDGQAGHAQLYLDEYSLTALRDLAEETTFVRDDGRDLWERLLLTFELAHRGSPELGIQAFNGALFEPARTDLITGGVTDPAERNERDDLPSVDNPTMVRFIEHLAFVERKGLGRERINYRDLRVEEIGHIYEGLLDYAPRLAKEDVEFEDRIVPRGAFFLDDRGTERKTSGSYYTPKDLVQEVIGRTLLPVIDDRLKEAGGDPKAQEEALLSIRVLDPACGSAAFLIAANDALATRLADIRWDAARQDRLADRAETLRMQGETKTVRAAEKPQREADYQQEERRARRDVLSHCIYGVDLNDMAVELAKVALWIHASVVGKPLSFLDHRIKHGNSLVGAPMDFLRRGIHPDAFKRREFSDPAKRNMLRGIFPPREAAKHWESAAGLFELQLALPDYSEMRERSTEEVRAKASAYRSFRAREAFRTWMNMADYWTSAYFHAIRDCDDHVPNQRGLVEITQEVAGGASAGTSVSSGDSFLWERVADLAGRYKFFHFWLEFPEVFFSSDGHRTPDSGFDVVVGNPPWDVIQADSDVDELVDFDALKSWFSQNRYAIAKGKKDLYKLFVVCSMDLVAPTGRLGLLVPSGVLMEEKLEELRRELFKKGSIVALEHFQNGRKSFFRSPHASYRFVALVYSPQAGLPHAFSVVIRSPEEMAGAAWLHLEHDRVTDVYGDGLYGAFFPTVEYFQLHKRVAASLAAFDREEYEVVAEFHASTDDKLLKSSGGGDMWSVLKNACISNYDATFAPPEKFVRTPDVRERLERKGLDPKLWAADDSVRLVFRDIARGDDSRTLIAALAPAGYVSSYDTPMLVPSRPPIQMPRVLAYLVGLANSFMFDFLLRPLVDKHVKGYVLERVPIPRYTAGCRWQEDVADLAQALSQSIPSGGWGQQALEVSARVDRRLAEVVGLTSSELAFVLDSFTSVARQQRAQYGTFLSKHLILDGYSEEPVRGGSG